jgi:hypothetical protein
VLQELAARTGASAWVIGSMLFFLAVWLVIAVRVLTARADEMEARAHLALEGDEDRDSGAGAPALEAGVGAPALQGRRSE